MPQIVIQIDEHQEAKIRDLIDSRQHFRLDGARVVDSDGKGVFLKRIEFVFQPDDFENLGIDHALAKSPPVDVPCEGQWKE